MKTKTKRKWEFTCYGAWWIPFSGVYLLPTITVFTYGIDLRWLKARLDIYWFNMNDDLPF